MSNTLFLIFYVNHWLYFILMSLLLSSFSHKVISSSLWPRGLQHTRFPCPSLSPRVCSNSCLLSWWCHPTMSSSVTPFSCLQSFPASGSFPITQPFTSGGQSIRISAPPPVLPMNIQDWFPLGLTGLISFQSKRLSRVFSSTIVWKHQLFGTQPSFMVQFSHPYMIIGKISCNSHVQKNG